jgi:hypothetical protein
MTAEERRHCVILRLRKPQPAVAARDLDPEGADPSERLDHLVTDGAFSIDGFRIDFLNQQQAESVEKFFRVPRSSPESMQR